ncbi:MAG: ABC transporter ATP-binding protein [Desulfurococcaceae archaeon]
MPDDVLYVENYRVYYRTLSGYIKAVDGVSFEIPHGIIMGIIGESGCGKSTLVQSIVLPKYPMEYIEGKVLLENEFDLIKIDRKERRKLLLSKLAYIPQYALDALPAIKKIRSFIGDLAADKNIPKDELLSKFKERLKQVNLTERVLDMYPIELSGGMRQRVVIAIATMLKPSLLIADEPTSALDVVTQRQVLELLLSLRDEKIAKSLLIISHDIASIRQISDMVATMYAGKIVEVGPIEETIKEPLHPYTSLLIKAVPSIGTHYKVKRLSGLSGSPPSLLNPPSGCRFHTRCPYATEKCREKEPPVIQIGKSKVACWLYTKG